MPSDPDIQLDDDIVLDKPAEQPDKVSPGGLTGVITGQGPAPGKAESFGRGALQGASLGFGDELSAAIDAKTSHFRDIVFVRTLAEKVNATGGSGGGLPVNNPDLTYQQRRDAYRNKNAEAQQANPWTYGGTIAGASPSLAIARALPFKNPIGAPAFAGGLYGAGASDAPLGAGTAVDTGIGAATGALLGGAIHGGGKFVRALAPAAAAERKRCDGPRERR